MMTHYKLYISIVVLIIASTATGLWNRHNIEQEEFKSELETKIITAYDSYKLSFNSTTNMLQQITTFIANDSHIQELFLAGKLAVEEEGGGAKGETKRPIFALNSIS